MSKLICIKIFMVVVMLMLSACEKPSNAQIWKIGKDQPKSKVLLESDIPKKIRFCSDEYKHISFPLTLHVIYDGQKYYNLLEGVCIIFEAKMLKVKFANPSSGKMARGTFEILDS